MELFQGENRDQLGETLKDDDDDGKPALMKDGNFGPGLAWENRQGEESGASCGR